MNNKISEITRKNIFDLLMYGINNSALFEEKIYYNFLGHSNPIDFLNHIYNLSELPSFDRRYTNAEIDIHMHTVVNDDWEPNWIFYDERFNLQNCEDKTFLKFLTTIFHSTIRDENGNWRKYLEIIQSYLHSDGYELYVAEYISKKEVYKWRMLSEIEIRRGEFVPFSLRIASYNLPQPRISITKRKAIIDLMHRVEENLYLSTETGLNYYESSCCHVVQLIKKYYIPKAYNENGEYIVTEDLNQLILRTSPKCVFDIIELYFKSKDIHFANEINSIISDIGYKLIDGKITYFELPIKIEIPNEENLKDIILEAERCFNKQDIYSKQRALEKIWDAFGRVKTTYDNNKKLSTNQIIKQISSGDAVLEKKLEEEFLELTRIGNIYQIRHFEKDKLLINDVRVKEYLYNRCLSLVNLIIKYIQV